MADRRALSWHGASLMIVIVMLVALCFDTLRRGFADLVAQEARFSLGRPVVAGTRPDPGQFDSIDAGFARALALAPDNPQLAEELGRLNELRAGWPGVDDAEARAWRERSLRHYRQAAALRPTSPHAQIGLVIAKLKLGEIDREFSFFLGRALEFGPWEPQVQLLAIQTGLTAWQGLNVATQEQLRSAIRSQLSWVQVDQRAAVRTLLRQFRRTDLLPAADGLR